MIKFLLLCSVTSVTLTTCHVSTSESYPAIDAIIQGIEKESWSQEEAPCLEKTLELLQNVKNFTLWATWVWDANKMPSGNLYSSWKQNGNIDQCMKPPWLDTHPQFKTQYCFTEVKMTQSELEGSTFDPYGSTEIFLKTKTRFGLYVNQFKWGVCVPASCQTHSVAKILRHMYLGTHFRALPNANITVESCHMASAAKEYYSIGYYLFWIFSAMLAILCFASTYYHMYMKHHITRSDSVGAVILESFCMMRNTSALSKSYNNEMKAVNGIRFLTACIVVFLHMHCFTYVSGCANARDMDHDRLFEKMENFSIIVDTFFFLSGLLYVKCLLDKKQQNVFVTLWKRYVRIFGVFGFVMVFIATVLNNVRPDNVSYEIIDLECSNCQNNWLWSLLMINSSLSTLCHGVTWYITCDCQFTMFSTVLCCIYHKSKRLGIRIFGFAAVLSIIIPGVITYYHQLTPLFFIDLTFILNMHSTKDMDYVYTTSYSRAGPYFVGIAMAYFMHVYKPTQHRRSVSTVMSIGATILSLLVMMMTGGLGYFYLDRKYGAIEAAVTAALHRIVWSAAVCCIVGICEYGHFPLLTKFLRWSVFTPLSRLSYGVYLVHVGVMALTGKIFPIKGLLVYNIVTVFIDTIGHVIVSIGLSYVLWLTVEAPFNNLSNRFICDRFINKAVEENNITKKNGLEAEDYQKVKSKAT